jgi:D-alanyl-lipoteichoic acid acyltransferase DltB (MBOAT superfamily)
MSWRTEYALLLAASTISVYVAGILLHKHKSVMVRKWVLIVTLLINLGMLFVFKYYNFFNESISIALGRFNIFYNFPKLELLLPVGISFYTFQVISYLVDVFRGKQPAEKHLGYFSVFVAFFPKLLSGPIERAKNLMPQFHEKHEFSYQGVTDGLKLIAWGLFQKIVIADRLALYVNQVYNNPELYSGTPVILATVFFAFQVYCDFSGYSDIAIGAGQVLGFRLIKNFDRPFHAKSVSEFWRRWHISLSTWLYDYIYSPIMISRRNWGQKAIVLSLLVTFIVCGLWHGANWTFIAFGLMHGLALSLEVVTKRRRKIIREAIPAILHNGISLVLTLSFIFFTFLFFRANSISDALLLIKNMMSVNMVNIDIGVPQVPRYELVVSFLSISILVCVNLIQSKIQVREFISKKTFLLRWTLYCVFVSYILFFRKTGAEFIYFQF